MLSPTATTSGPRAATANIWAVPRPSPSACRPADVMRPQSISAAVAGAAVATAVAVADGAADAVGPGDGDGATDGVGAGEQAARPTAHAIASPRLRNTPASRPRDFESTRGRVP